MGNLRQKFTDEEWEDILKNGYTSTERLTPKEIKEKYGLDINESVGARCIEMSDEGITEIERKIREYPLSPEECFLAKENPVKNLVTALKKDKDYYEGWKANIAMSFQDEIDNYLKVMKDTEYDLCMDINTIANKAAERFLKQLMS